MARKPKADFIPWDLGRAVDFIAEIQPTIRALGYHVCLGGGVLNKGESQDLDLWIIPLNGYESNPEPIMAWLWENIGQSHPLRDSPDYGPDAFPHAVRMEWVEYLGSRIDIFIQ